MTFKDLRMMSDADQTKWLSEHTVAEQNTMLDEWFKEIEHETMEYRIKSFRDRLKAYEIAKAVKEGYYYGVTSDGKPWRIDFSDPCDDDWTDDYLHTDYMY